MDLWTNRPTSRDLPQLVGNYSARARRGRAAQEQEEAEQRKQRVQEAKKRQSASRARGRRGEEKGEEEGVLTTARLLGSTATGEGRGGGGAAAVLWVGDDHSGVGMATQVAAVAWIGDKGGRGGLRRRWRRAASASWTGAALAMG